MVRRIRERHHPRQQPREQVALPRTTTPRDPWVREGRCDLAIGCQHPAVELLLPVDALAAQLVVRRVRVGEELRREEAAHARTLERGIHPAPLTATESELRETLLPWDPTRTDRRSCRAWTTSGRSPRSRTRSSETSRSPSATRFSPRRSRHETARARTHVLRVPPERAALPTALQP